MATIKIKHPGLLHKKLGKKGPLSLTLLHTKLAAAKKRGDVKEEREILFAINFHHHS
jgi:hypothetical protein